MTITKTVKVPANRWLTVEVPREITTESVDLAFTPAGHPCPICAANIDPATGNPRYNAKTVAAIEEGIAISNGEIPAKRFHSLAEMLEDLDRDDPDDLDD